MPYKLSATLRAHTSDVRAVGSPTDQLVLSASRDTTAISWKRSSVSPSSTFTAEAVLKAGSLFVNAVAYIPPTPDAPEGYAVTGGQDAVINIFNLQNPRNEPDFCLIGHSENICTLDVTSAGTIISGSWDKTAKVWKNYAVAHDLKGHQQSVWAVLGIDENQYLTGSADNTIKLWQEHKNMHTFRGHQQAVRGLAIISDIGFASCSNDSEIRVWTLGGDVIYTLSGHTSFVYSLSVLPSGDIVSAGEDRTVRVWKDGECSQTIVHPAISVWTLSTMPNGDIVSGCSDGIVRIFSEAEERWASAEELKGYDESVASQALPSQQLGDLNKEQLQDVDGLVAPGKKDGEVKMIRNDSKVEAYTWDSMARKWQKVGEVVDAVGSNRKQLYQGKEYDYVFDVDIQDGVPPLKLPYNASENPYAAAQRFLQSNDLSLNYVDQVVQFIEKNTAGVKLGGEAEELVDPFTGASRYRASQSTSAAGAGGQYMDPFTGASRYVASGPQTSAPPSVDVSDPRSVPQKPMATAPRILPVAKAVSFNQANVTLMRTKFLQLDEAFRNEISTSTIAMYPQEVALLEEIFSYLTVSTSTTPPPSLTVAHIEAIMSILERWPTSQRFPLIDLSRLVLAFCPKAPFDTPGLKASFIEALFASAGWSDSAQETSIVGKVKETNTTLMLKALANAVGEGESGNEEVMVWMGKVLDFIGRVPYRLLAKAQKVAFATILFNISCEGLKTCLETSIRDAVVDMTIKILNEEMTETEAVYRTLVGFGNLVHAATTQNAPLAAAHLGDLQKNLPALSKQFTDPRVSNVSREIAMFL